MLHFYKPSLKNRNILLEYLYELLNTDKGKKLAIGFLCHLQAHRNYTLLVGWFVYLLGMRELMEQKKWHCSFEQFWNVRWNLHGTCCAGKEKKMNVDTWKHWENHQIRENHRPMKTNEQLHRLRKDAIITNGCQNAAIAEIIVGHLHLGRETKAYYNLQIKLQNIK